MTICYVNWGFPQTDLTCAALPPPALPVMQPGAVIPAGPAISAACAESSAYSCPWPCPCPSCASDDVPSR